MKQKVNHGDDPMPDEEVEDVVISQAPEQINCPITKKPFVNPMRKYAIFHHFVHLIYFTIFFNFF